MKIGFVNYTKMEYDVDTPYKKPLGGSESGLCYLTPELSKFGHEITLFTHTKSTYVKRGVIHSPIETLNSNPPQDLDFLVIQNTPYAVVELFPKFKGNTHFLLWSGHDIDQGSATCLEDSSISRLFSAFILVSNWQRERYLKTFAIKPEQSYVIGNAISPVFEKLYFPKKRKPEIVYTSAPFRGLENLFEIFPLVKKSVPNATLKIFSSLDLYQQDEKYNTLTLYKRFRGMEGVVYSPSIGQELLAKELSEASIFAYPSTFPETSCISLMEAMATGLDIVTSDLGALKETVAGYGKLINNSQDFKTTFATEVVTLLKNPKDNRNQVKFAIDNYSWRKRALEWDTLFKSLAL